MKCAALLTIIKQGPPIRERENQPWKWEQIWGHCLSIPIKHC